MKLFEAAGASKLLLQTILVRGGAFKARYECFDEGEKERIFVVANLKPTGDDKIMLFTATTQIHKRRKHHRARADLVLVPLDPLTYDGVTEKCVLDCESPVRRKRTDFLKDVEGHVYTPLTTVPESIMAKIVAAVRETRTLSPAEKRLILGDQSDGSAIV
jgi:hypothetical protein